MGDKLQAAVPVYGSQPAAEDVKNIKAAILIHDASSDERIVKGIPAYKEALKANNVNFEHHMYEGAQHGFHNDTTPRFDDKAAKLAWTSTVDFFKINLK